MEKQNDFFATRFSSYQGPNIYLDVPSLIFSLYIDPNGPGSEYYQNQIVSRFPSLKDAYPTRVIKLFTLVCCEINNTLRLPYNNKYHIGNNGNYFSVAIPALDANSAKAVVNLVRDWFISLKNNDDGFDFENRLACIQSEFNKTVWGNMGVSLMIEKARQLNIPAQHLQEENQFQWGYGRNQLRGYNTFSNDSSLDLELLKNNYLIDTFLLIRGFPAQTGNICHTEEALIGEAQHLGWPVRLRPTTVSQDNTFSYVVESDEEARNAYFKIATSQGKSFNGIILTKQKTGIDHHILMIGGKYQSCVKSNRNSDESINATDFIHPENIVLVENIARYFNITLFELHIISTDISKNWKDGDFEIYGISSNRDITDYITRHEVGKLDIPAKIFDLFYRPAEGSRIPIIAGNFLSNNLINRIIDKITDIKPGAIIGSLREDGVYINKKFLVNNAEHDLNCKVVLRDPDCEIAILTHSQENIQKSGIIHLGLDIAILINANKAESVLIRDLFPGGLLIEVSENLREGKRMELVLSRDLIELHRSEIQDMGYIDEMVYNALEPHLETVFFKYEISGD